MLTLKIKTIIVLLRDYNKVLTTINNLVELLSRHSNYKGVEVVKDILNYLAIR